MEFVSESLQETQTFAQQMAAKILDTPRNQALVIALHGELGAGKTTFTQFFVQALGGTGPVKSPTFVLMKNYQLPNNRSLYHLDCYRINEPSQIETLQLHDVFSDPKNIVLIEWAECIATILPPDHASITFAHLSPTSRRISSSL